MTAVDKLQLVACLMSLTGLWLSVGIGGNKFRIGCVVGLLAQPVWFALGVYAHLWVLCFMSGLYFMSYARGFHRTRNIHGTH